MQHRRLYRSDDVKALECASAVLCAVCLEQYFVLVYRSRSKQVTCALLDHFSTQAQASLHLISAGLALQGVQCARATLRTDVQARSRAVLTGQIPETLLAPNQLCFSA